MMHFGQRLLTSASSMGLRAHESETCAHSHGLGGPCYVSILLVLFLFSNIVVAEQKGIEIDDDTNVRAAAVVLFPVETVEDVEEEKEGAKEETDQAEDKPDDDEPDKEDGDDKDEDDPFADILKKQPQFAQQVRETRKNVESIIGGDLTFAACICEATDEEKALMRVHAQVEMQEILDQVAEQLKAQFGLRAFMVPGKGQKSSRKIRRDAVEQILTAVYWPGKAAGDKKPKKMEMWEDALRERERFGFLATARVFVEALNERLYLDAEQRDALTESIADCRNDEWQVYINVMIHNPEYFPNLPKNAIKPHLTAEQYEMWKAMPKSQMGSMPWQVFQNQAIFLVADGNKNPWFGEEDEPGKAAAVKQRLAQLAVRVAKVEKKKEQAETKVATKARRKQQPVSLHALGMLGMQSGAAVIKQAIEDGAEVNEESKAGETPLHVAAKNGVMKNVELLLANGAIRGAKNKDGTLLPVAIKIKPENRWARVPVVQDERDGAPVQRSS